MTFRDIAEVRADGQARVYEHGWQSWSPTGLYAVGGSSPRPVRPDRLIMGYRPETPAPDEGFQGEGLLALDPGNGEPIRIWWAPEPHRDVPSIRLSAVGDRLVVSANGPVVETTYASPIEQALGEWADALATQLGVKPVVSLPPIWCTWYQYFRDVTEEDVLENLAAIDELGLDVGVVQLDDGYQAGLGDWLERSPRFPHPLAELTERIRATGRRAGIWTAPFLVGERCRLAQEHPDWLVGDADAGYNWEQRLFALDVTHSDAAAYLQQVFRSLSAWGFDFFKIDFIYAGALPGRRRQDTDSIAAYREGLRLIREAVGPAATLLGCGAPLLPSIGEVESMRVSPDVAPHFEPRDGDLTSPGQRSALLAGRARAFQHGRWWVNDPDCLIARPGIERRSTWADHVERYGGLRGSSDRLRALDDWGLEATRRLLRPSSAQPFPVGEWETL